AQLPDRSEALLLPRLNPGQELVYSGSYREESLGGHVEFQRSYRLQNHIFVQDVNPRGMHVAFLTTLELRPLVRAGGPVPKSQPRSVRLDLARVDNQGRITPLAGGSLAVPIDGPPTVECGAFVEMPLARVGKNSSWEVAEERRPPRSWQVAGTEVIHSTN